MSNASEAAAVAWNPREDNIDDADVVEEDAKMRARSDDDAAAVAHRRRTTEDTIIDMVSVLLEITWAVK